MREEARKMFYWGYDNYIKYAFPEDELDPIHCVGRGHDWTDPYVFTTMYVLRNMTYIITYKIVQEVNWIWGVLVACWLKWWSAIERLQVRTTLGTSFFYPWVYSPSKWGDVHHHILLSGCQAVSPEELVNISNLCYSSFLVQHIWYPGRAIINLHRYHVSLTSCTKWPNNKRFKGTCKKLHLVTYYI